MLVGDARSAVARLAKVGEDRITVLEGRRALQYASQRTLYRLMHGAGSQGVTASYLLPGSRKELHTLNARVLEEHGHTRDDLLSCPTVAMAAHDANLPVGTWVAIEHWGRYDRIPSYAMLQVTGDILGAGLTKHYFPLRDLLGRVVRVAGAEMEVNAATEIRGQGYVALIATVANPSAPNLIARAGPGLTFIPIDEPVVNREWQDQLDREG